MRILMSCRAAGYPTEYLIARIRGRRSSLKDEPHGKPSNEFSEMYDEESHQSEFRWVYLQMNEQMRRIFVPFFTYFELRTLVICLRFKSLEDNTETEKILNESLLSEEIRRVLVGGADLPVALHAIAGALTPSLSWHSLMQAYATGGLQSFEKVLYVKFLEYTMRLQLHPVMARFFTFFIDCRNIMQAYKGIRWDITSHPEYVKGGTIKRSSLGSLFQNKEMSDIGDMVRMFTGQPLRQPVVSFIESTLKTALTRKLEHMMWDYPETGLILHYLWRYRLKIERHNVLYYGRNIDGDVIGMEVVD